MMRRYESNATEQHTRVTEVASAAGEQVALAMSIPALFETRWADILARQVLPVDVHCVISQSEHKGNVRRRDAGLVEAMACARPTQLLQGGLN